MLTETAAHIPVRAPSAILHGIPRIEEAVRTGRRANGTALSEEDRRQFSQPSRRLPAPSWSSIRPIRLVLADARSSTAPLTLHQGTSARSSLRYLGEWQYARRCRSSGCHAERILLTGDLLVHPVPFAFGSFIADWARTMTLLQAARRGDHRARPRPGAARPAPISMMWHGAMGLDGRPGARGRGPRADPRRGSKRDKARFLREIGWTMIPAGSAPGNRRS